MRSRRGSALIIVMMLAIVLAAAGTFLLPAVDNADAAARNEARWIRIGHIADGGIEQVLAMMRAGEDVSGNILLSLGDGAAYVRVDPGTGKNEFTIESTANLTESPKSMRTLRAIVRRDGNKVVVLRWERS